jgi:hypothetical protein
MASIKRYMYDLIDVPMPTPKINSVFNSMGSIIFSTQRTFADLKKIESVMSGYLRSRQKSKIELSLNSTNSTYSRSKSEEHQSLEYAFTAPSTPIAKITTQISNKNIRNRSRFSPTPLNTEDLFSANPHPSFKKKGTDVFEGSKNLNENE